MKKTKRVLSAVFILMGVIIFAIMAFLIHKNFMKYGWRYGYTYKIYFVGEALNIYDFGGMTIASIACVVVGLSFGLLRGKGCTLAAIIIFVLSFLCLPLSASNQFYIYAFLAMWLVSGIVLFGEVIMSSIEDRNSTFRAMDQEITKAYVEIFGRPGVGFYHDCGRLSGFANEKVTSVIEQYIKENGIMSVVDTSSNLGSCGVSKTDFYFDLDKTSFTAIRTEKTPLDYYIMNNLVDLKSELNKYVLLKKEGCKSLAKKIALEDIVAFRVYGNRHISTNIREAGPNIKNAVAGGLIAGAAGAVIGSRVGVQEVVTTTTVDDRKIAFILKQKGTLVTREIISLDIDNTIKALRNLIPEKEESIINLATKKETQKVHTSVAAELKEFKELLDSGIITQEEFDAKKKQLLEL